MLASDISICEQRNNVISREERRCFLFMIPLEKDGCSPCSVTDRAVLHIVPLVWHFPRVLDFDSKVAEEDKINYTREQFKGAELTV